MRKYLTLVAFAFAGISAFASFGAAAAPLQQSTRADADGSYRTADNWNDRVCCKKGNRDWWTIRRDCNNAGGYQTANRECRDDNNGGGIIDLNLGLGSRVCCKRGWQDWWTNWGACKRAGGHQTRNEECRDDWNDKWDQRWWGWTGNDWDRRVCCKRGNRDWWSTARECRNSFGYETANRECRNDNNDGNWGDNAQRVCCKRGWQDWWTTSSACQRAGGEQTRNRECRDDWNDKWDQRWWGWSGGDWERRVCCKQGNRDWWSTARECRNSFGYETANRECRDDNHNGGNWNDGNGGNYNDGWVDPYGRPDRRVCCKKGNRDWWSSARDCHYANGYETRNDECRND